MVDFKPFNQPVNLGNMNWQISEKKSELKHKLVNPLSNHKKNQL